MIIGLTGTLAAGKGVVSDFLKKQGFVYLSLSDELREIVKGKKIEVTRENLQYCGNKLREEEGSEILAKKISEKIKNQEYKKAIIDGIRNPAEIVFLKNNLKEFFLIAVDAPTEKRFKRMVERNRESDPKTFEDFIKIDNKDKGIGEKSSGQGVSKCMEMAEFTLINEGSLNEIEEKINTLYLNLKKLSPRPSWDEYFMGICDSVSKRATCDRGKSGCVIVKNKQILATGYVGSPIGLPHCDEIGHQFKKMIHENGKETQHCLRTTHAEQNAICQAARKGISIDGATVYCKMTPCYVCAKMIINCGIKRVVCQKRYHAGEDSEEIFKLTGVNLEIFEKEIEKYEKQ